MGDIPDDVGLWLHKYADSWFIGGSRGALGKADADLDIVVLCNSGGVWAPPGFEPSGNKYACEEAVMPNLSYSREGVDLIICNDATVFRSWWKAHQIVSALQLTSRDDRVRVHHIVLERQGTYLKLKQGEMKVSRVEDICLDI